MRFVLPVLPALFAIMLAIPIQPAQTAEDDLQQIWAFTHATIYTGVDEKPIENGTLVIAQGKIVAVGTDVKIPKDAKTIDLKGQVMIPGLVDTHSHIGIYQKPRVSAHADGNEMSGPVQPGIRALDAIDPNDIGIRMAVAGGITTANIMPGSGNAIGGSTAYVKLRGSSIEEMRILGKLKDGTEVLGGMKMANGENPKGYGRGKQQAPFTRMKIAALQREQFQKAKEYQEKRKGKLPTDRDLNLEQLVEVLEKKRTVHFHCHRTDDLLTAIRIAEEFDFELVLQHASEGYRIADVLAKKKIPVSLTMIDSPGGKAETMGLLEENAAILQKAGVIVTINTDDFITESRFFLRTGSLAVRGGMSEMEALRALTITPAKVLHLDHRIGSLERGKDADFVILTGAPFSVYSKVQQTWIDGMKRFDADVESSRVYRDGGFLLPRSMELPKAFPAEQPLPKTGVTQEVKQQAPEKIVRTRIIAGRVHIGNGKVLEDQVIVIEAGRIKSIRENDEPIPENELVLVAKEVTPGFIDPFTVAGLSGAWNIPADQDQDEPSDPNQADLRVIDGFNANEAMLEFLRQNGVSITHTTAGRINPIAGTSGIFRTDKRVGEGAAINPGFAILVNLGEVPKDAFKAKGPQTRMAVAGLIRKAFADAQVYKDKPITAKNAKLAALTEALEGKMPVIFAAHRADDIRTAIRIADEFKLKPVIALGTEAFLLADELAKRKIPVIVHPTQQRAGDSMETVNTLLANAALLKKAGVNVMISTAFEGYVPKNRNLRSEAAMAAVNGLGHAGALQAITLDAAKFLKIDKDYGSIEVGKVADIVLFDGDPFEHSTHVERTILNGKVVFDRTEYLKLPFDRRILPVVSGGPGAGCCLGTW